jgi:hypothetical protein
VTKSQESAIYVARDYVGGKVFDPEEGEFVARGTLCLSLRLTRYLVYVVKTSLAVNCRRGSLRKEEEAREMKCQLVMALDLL